MGAEVEPFHQITCVTSVRCARKIQLELTMDQSTGREARLKREYAHLYPPLQSGRWEPAGLMAERMVAWLLREHKGYVAPHRVLRDEHFEFRSGPRAGGTSDGHSRREDPPTG